MDTEITTQLSLRFKQMRAMEHLTGAADLTSHILTRIAGGGAGNGPKVGGGDKATIPINDTAVDDANAIYVLLLKWSMGHSRALHVAPPAIALGWSRLEEKPNGFPSWATPVDAHVLVASVVDWLMAWDEAIAQLPIAPIYWDDLDDELRKIRKRWMPEAPKVQVFATRDCPSCGKRKTVVVNLDDESNAVVCACTFCGWVIPHTFTQKYLEPSGRHAA